LVPTFKINVHISLVSSADNKTVYYELVVVLAVVVVVVESTYIAGIRASIEKSSEALLFATE